MRRAGALRGKTVGVIGAGTMGQALIRGLLHDGMASGRIVASDPRAGARRGLTRLGVRMHAKNAPVARQADVLLLAVKPQEMRSLLQELRPWVRRRPLDSPAFGGVARDVARNRSRGRPERAQRVEGRREGNSGIARRAPPLVISIAAGITRRTLESRLPGTPVARVMPNLPATVGAGFSAFTLGRRAGPAHRAVVEAIFGAVGETVELPERLFDAVTAVSGSGPAYVFFLVHAWEGAARALGLPRAVARRAVRQTLAGSVRLLASASLEPEAWIRRVASKRGTTEAALSVLTRRRLEPAFREALRAAARRSQELSWTSRAS